MHGRAKKGTVAGVVSEGRNDRFWCCVLAPSKTEGSVSQKGAHEHGCMSVGLSASKGSKVTSEE